MPQQLKKQEPVIFCAKDKASIPAKIAELLEVESQKAIRRHGRFTVAFSGGSLPRVVAEGLLPIATRLQMDKWHVYYADERCVPHDHADSNHRAVMDELINKLPASMTRPQMFPIAPECVGDADKAAVAYEKTIQSTLPHSLKNDDGDTSPHNRSGIPVFDCILLGMGPDGHTCSLFPNHSLLREHGKMVAGIYDSPKPPPQRITVTFPVLYQADKLIFVAAGAGKKEVYEFIHGSKKAEGGQWEYPSRLVTNKYAITWFLDGDAAEKLDKSILLQI